MEERTGMRAKRRRGEGAAEGGEDGAESERRAERAERRQGRKEEGRYTTVPPSNAAKCMTAAEPGAALRFKTARGDTRRSLLLQCLSAPSFPR